MAPLLLSLIFAAFGLAEEGAAPKDCVAPYAAIWKFTEAKFSEPSPDFRKDLDYLTETQRVSTLGKLDTRFVKEWNTRIYYSATAKPRRDGTLPFSDHGALAQIIFIHGSGTGKATGRNFAKKMNDLTNLGYSTASFDLPNHGFGPTSEAFENPDYFFNWLHRIVEDLRIPGKPLYLAGHSFGPQVIAEYARRFPNSVDGITLFSPVAFDKTTRDWYYQKTMHMKFDNTAPNQLGGAWGDRLMDRFRWNSGAPADNISLLNPKMKVRVVTGDREEYAPAPTGGAKGLPIGPNTYDVCAAIQKYIRHAECSKLAGVGHQVMDHKDASGFDTTIKEIIALDGRRPEEAGAMKYQVGMKPLTSREVLAQRYARDRMFARWADEKLSPEKIRIVIGAQKDYGAKALITEYDALIAKRAEAIFESIRNTKEWAPDFYEANKSYIEQLKKPKDDTKSTLIGRYFEFLQNAPAELRDEHAVFTP